MEPAYPDTCVQTIKSTPNGVATVMVGNCFGRAIDYIAAEYTNEAGKTVCNQQKCVACRLPHLLVCVISLFQMCSALLLTACHLQRDMARQQA